MSTILNHYNLTNPFPTSWPSEKDDSDASDDEKSQGLSRHYVRRSKSRYSALERHGERKSLVPGAEKLAHGQENLVQKDEADPLGGTDSVVRTLRQKGLPVEEDSRLRNRFLLSSTTFSPNLFLSQVHSHASTKELLQGLEALSRSIDSKSASLKVLVESNFERFVRAKTTIDNVYAEMRNQGADPEANRSRGHSRVTSRESRHFRTYSGQGARSPNPGVNKPLSNNKKKNALTKESEYGVQGIKAPLIEVAVKAEEIWGPALGGREKEGNLKSIADSVESTQGIFRVNKGLSDCIKRKDYDGLIEEYGKARKFAEDARQIADRAYRSQQQLSDQQVHQIVITGRMWSEVERRIEDFKRDVWRRLTYVQMSSQSSMSQAETEEHMPLISVLLELGVDDNPIWVWLLSRYDYLKNKINATFERSRVEIEVLRRRLANGDPPAPSVVAGHLKCSDNMNTDDKTSKLDTVRVLELWDLIYNSLSHLLSTKSGILAEIIEFWDKAQQFIDGRIQKTLPIGVEGRSRKHHRLSSDGTKDLQEGVAELVDMLQDYVYSFFVDPPIDDVSMLYSPSPNTPTPVTPQALSPYAHQDSRFRFDENNPAPSSSKRGEAWEEFAFWPPYSNSLSGVHYLEQIMNLIAAAATEMAAMKPVASRQTLPEKLKLMVAAARERSLRAVCAQWSKDSCVSKYMEDWSLVNEAPFLTHMPGYLIAFENVLLSGLQKISYIPQVVNNRMGSATIVTPPGDKFVEAVSTELSKSLRVSLEGVEGIALHSQPPDNPSSFGEISTPTANTTTSHRKAPNKATRILLTLMNFKHLERERLVADLWSQFETHFSAISETERQDSQTFLEERRDELTKAYTTPIVEKLSVILHTGIASESWMPTVPRPNQIRPYVYEALLVLVAVHSELSSTTNPFSVVWKKSDRGPKPTTIVTIEQLVEDMSKAFQSAFEQQSAFPLNALMQATLEVEFVAQTMKDFMTALASREQKKVYEEIDTKTTREVNEALQGELPGMSNTLKRLRQETKGEFSCFKIPK